MARLALEELAGAVTGAGKVHRAVSDRIFGSVRHGVGPASLPAKALHDAISASVYGGIAVGSKLAGRAAGCTVNYGSSGTRPPSETKQGALLLSIVQGLRGDTLEVDEPALVQPMSIRVDGRAVRLDADSVAAAFPDARPRIVVFLHGLMETESSWALGGRARYGERLESDLDVTSVQIRFNSGLRISRNGREFSELMDRLVEAWPVAVDEIALVGHSMGGLIARSACHLADEEELFWVRRVNHVVCLGSPHLGAPLEQTVHYGSALLAALPETAPFGRLLRRRSVGIRDLFSGSLVDEDWACRDVDSLRRAVVREIPLLDGAMHCFVSATVTANPRNPFGRVIGDGLVLVPSASGAGKTRRIGFREEDGVHVGSANHFTLLNHETVYEHLLQWLRTPPIAFSNAV